MNKFSANFKGGLFVLISALMYGSYGLFAKYLESYDIFFQTYIRCFIIALILIIYGLWKNQFRKIEKEDFFWWFIIIGFTLFTIAPITYAFRHLNLSTSSFLFYSSYTIFTYLFGFLFFKEKISIVKIISFISAIIGLIIIFNLNFYGAAIIAVLMAIFNGFASGGEITFTKKISHKYSDIQITTYVFLAIGITHLIISLLLKENQDLSIFTNSFSLIILIGYSLVAILGMITVIAGFRLIEPSIGAIIGLTEIVFSVLFGILFFQEKLELVTLIGGTLIIFAALLPSLVDYINLRKNRVTGS